MTDKTFCRDYAEGIGEAVANRTINRKIKDLETGEERVEKWGEVAHRVALGNSLLAPPEKQKAEFDNLYKHIAKATVLMSGRHLQHGDENQPSRNMEIYTNCATSPTSFLTFYLLLNGSGVGRSYDDDMILVDWTKMPTVVCTIDHTHPDAMSGEIHAQTLSEAVHLYKYSNYEVINVEDSREGWAKVIEKMETTTWLGGHDRVLIVDFSDVRERGKPIGGMQGRPASGPGPLMSAIKKITSVRDSQMSPWRAAMFVDHFLAECVLVGGARRAARMSTKTWRDPEIEEFVSIKRDGFLWSSNNSVTVDALFWRYARFDEDKFDDPALATHARAVLDKIARASYFDQSGEPGLINVDMLEQNSVGLLSYLAGKANVGSDKFRLSSGAKTLVTKIAGRATAKRHQMITNPCGEIALHTLGGYCTIADVVPYHADTDDEAEDAFRAATRALIRVNTMDCLYSYEVRRTNRIGVSMTGIHEYAAKRFGFSWQDLIDEQLSLPFWQMLARFKRAVDDEAEKYSRELGLAVPHTNTTIKPAGTTSKLFALSEGAHLPAMREYLRWVQFRYDDPLVETYQKMGYPVKKLKAYEGTIVVGFPTSPEICRISDKVTTASEATPAEQYQWLRLLEKYYINGVDENGEPLTSKTGNQVSYTLKYDPQELSFADYKQALIDHQSTVRCCSVMPQVDTSVYEYQPEQSVTKEEYTLILESIQADETKRLAEDVGFEHVDCAGGACPVDFNSASVATA